MIIDVYYLGRPCLLNIVPGYSDTVLFGLVRQRGEVHLNAQTVPSAGWVWAEDLICSRAESHWQYMDKREWKWGENHRPGGKRQTQIKTD